MLIAAVFTTTTISFLSPRRLLLSHQPLLLLNNPTSKLSFLHLQARPPMASSFVAEYAKSNRSACKTCSDKIAANALRLGVVTKDKQRGFDATKWHHFHCFSFKSNSVSSLSAIRGFDSLKSDDQEAMKKLVEELGKEKDIDDDAAAGQEQNISKKKKRGDSDDAVEKQESSKKLQLSVSEEANVKITLATSDIKDIYQGATLLPNWKAFHSIIFLEKDAGLQDSSKIAAFDFDGCLANTDVKSCWMFHVTGN
uniref:PARP-type domain-containing protein n=1 Tax=Chenopodium quinoa TaxID=63459 RepID=A0A803N9Z8_CHEQI